MTLPSHEWICPACKRTPSISVELHCPLCNSTVVETFKIDFTPACDDVKADHDSHMDQESRFVRKKYQPFESGKGRYSIVVPQFFKDHIKSHEDWAFERGAASREPEVRKRIDELNKQAQSIVASLTTEILLNRQNECKHSHERHWVKASEAGKMNLVCNDCFKVLDVKFVGISTQHGETIGLKIVTEK